MAEVAKDHTDHEGFEIVSKLGATPRSWSWRGWTTKVLRRAQSSPGGRECSGASNETGTLPTPDRYRSVYPRYHSPCTRGIARGHGPIHCGRCGLLDNPHPSEKAIAPTGHRGGADKEDKQQSPYAMSGCFPYVSRAHVPHRVIVTLTTARRFASPPRWVRSRRSRWRCYSV